MTLQGWQLIAVFCSGRRGDDQATRRLHGLDLHGSTRIDPGPEIF
jgi:hypothetical protein